jgi:quinol monooxygenase YgiN
MNELSVVGLLKVREGTESEIRGLLAALVTLPRKDQGNLRYELYQDRHDPRRFFLVQRRADEASYIKHDKHSAHIQEFQKKHFERIESAEVYQFVSVD